MIQDKKVSIISCFYNEEKYLAKAIDSVLAQTYKNFELILVNDGSTDKSDEIVKSYHDERIKYIAYKNNRYQAYARNQGLEIATGDYIGFFDCDDIMRPDKMEKQVKYLNEHADITLISGGFSNIDAKGEICENFVVPQYFSDEEIKAFMLYGNCIAFAGAAMFRREMIDKHHIRFDETNRSSEDYRLFIDMLPYGKFVNVKECFFDYRINHGSKSSTAVKSDENAYDIEVKKLLGYAWRERGFSLTENDIEFMHYFLYKRIRIWKPNDILMGIRIYTKIKKQLDKLDLREGKLILKYYRQQWLRTYQIYWLMKKVFGIAG